MRPLKVGDMFEVMYSPRLGGSRGDLFMKGDVGMVLATQPLRPNGFDRHDVLINGHKTWVYSDEIKLPGES
mgnify:CR=1 FL=1